MAYGHEAADAGGFAEGVHAANIHTILQVGVVTDRDWVGVTCSTTEAAAAAGECHVSAARLS
jgi:hypothetical protein